MDVNSSSFLKYLEKFQKKMGITDIKKFSLYKYSSDFLKFLINDLKIDTSFSSMSISDIISEGLDEQLKLEDGQEDKTGKNFLTDVLLKLFKDEDFIKDIDTSQDGQLDKEEIDKFLGAIDFDGDKNITLDEIFSSIDKLKDGTLQPSLSPTPSVEPPTSTDSTGGSGGGGGGDINPGNNEDTKPKTIADMSLDELKTEKTTREKSVTEAENNLNAVYDGTNENIKTAKDAYATAKSDYETAIDNDEKISADLKKNIKTNIGDIENKEKEISETKTSINTKESEVFKQEAVVSEDDATIQGLEAALNDLNSQSAGDDAEKAKEIASKKADVQAQLDAAKKKKTKDEAELQQKKDELQALNDEKDAKEGELKVLEDKRAAIEKDLAENTKYSQATKDALAEFQKAKTNLDSVKSTEETKAKEAVTKARESVTEVDKAINEKTKTKTEKDNSLKSDVFGENVKYTASEQYITDSSGMKYMVIAPADADPDEELPMLVYLHGSGEVGSSIDTLKGSSLPRTMLTGQTITGQGQFNLPENFRGYIICPVLSSGNWCNDNAENGIRSIIKNFSSTHKVDKDNIALAGHSLGGMGTIYMAKHMDDVFSRAAVISGYQTRDKEGTIDISSIKIPIMGFVGTNGDDGAYNYMNPRDRKTGKRVSIFPKLVEVKSAHGDAPGWSLLQDTNRNGRSDFFESLFPDA